MKLIEKDTRSRELYEAPATIVVQLELESIIADSNGVGMPGGQDPEMF